jgi:conjugal transfer pilus assembly protein TraW
MVRFVLLVSLYALSSAKARDFGTHGPVFPIEETDPIVRIQTKLKSMGESGELKNHHQLIQEQAKSSVLHPPAVKGITKATKSRVFFYDPTFTIKNDLKDPHGKVFAKKGTRINPLEKTTLSSSLLFFDGEDVEQVTWAKTHQKEKDSTIKLILTNGSPLHLAEEIGQAVYFDQNGLLTKKLGITHVPAIVSQEGLWLRIEEISFASQSLGDIQ